MAGCPQVAGTDIRRNFYLPIFSSVPACSIKQPREPKQSSETKPLEGFCFQCSGSSVEVALKLG